MIQTPDNLPQLRDIHLPNSVSLWPLAYGWWVILIGIVVLVLLIWLWQYISRKSKKLYALRMIKKLEAKNTIKSAAVMSEMLRRVCIYKYPSAISLSGKDWIDFLAEHGKAKLSDQASDLLANAPYMPDSLAEFDEKSLENLRAFCLNWIGENL